ncbi:hypothetical protein OPQ81_004163 [Rhizoctonia solani]|nr:hypothetical protein OPQ81_004163 [Rhizoctonia solani]
MFSHCGFDTPPSIRKNNVVSQEPSHFDFMSIPVDVFKEIASFLTPGDILALARVNKFLRHLLMHRSAKHIWRAAERSVDRLPPCPRHLTNPQYAALVFSKECSSCGTTVMRQLDHILGVRLCNACRSVKVVELNYAPSPIRDYISTSSDIKNPRRNEIRFALKSEIHELADQWWDLPDDYEDPDVLRWINKKLRRRLERAKHATALARYTHLASIAREQALDDTKLQRVIDICSRLRTLGWKEKHIRMACEDSRKAWLSLVNIPKPLTDQAWTRLYPKLLRLLKSSKRRLRDTRAKIRLSRRYKLVEEMLTKIRTTKLACLEIANTGSQLINNAGTSYMPFPVLSELLQCHVFKDLVETDRSLDATKAKFETYLLGLVNDDRNARKREYVTGNELVEDAAPFTSQLTTASYDYVTSQNNVLFRADSVFSYNGHAPVFYPGNFTSLFDIEFTVARSPEEDVAILDLVCSRVKYCVQGASYVSAVLKELGRPDASHIEMEALGERFICGRCPSRTIHTWTSLISHVLHAYNCEISISSRTHQRPGISYNNVHDWTAWAERPLTKLLNDQEINSHNIVTCSYVTGRTVECRICYDLATPCSSTRKLTMLHLRYYHNILQPVFGEHYFEVSDDCASSGGHILEIANTSDSGP